MFQHAVTKSDRVEANTFSSVTLVMSSNETNVRELVSLYLTAESGKVNDQPIHKGKFDVPVDKEVHQELYMFKIDFANFTSCLRNRQQ